MHRPVRSLTAVILAMALLFTVVPGLAQARELVVYSGRSEPLVGPLFQRFTEETGIQVAVRYGDTAELAATILEEGRNTPADVFFAQDAGALGALAAAGRLQTLPSQLLEQVDARFRSPEGYWLGTSGRARVVAYNTDLVDPEQLPGSIWGFTDPRWKGRIGWAPTNGSFQAFVTALRVLEGDQRAEEWLRGILANEPRVYRNNVAIVDAVGRGEIHVGFVNHYYLFRFLKERGDAFPVRHHYTNADAGSIVNIAGVGILDVSQKAEEALALVEFLLSQESQQFFTDQNAEYPVVLGVEVQSHPLLLPLSDINTPDIDLSQLEDLQGTLELLFKVGVL